MYASWGGFVVMANKLIDFYLYYLAAEALKRGLDLYQISDPAWAELGRVLAVPHYAPPYRYPPLTALLVMPLLALKPRLAAFVWAFISALALVGSAWLLAEATRSEFEGKNILPFVILGFFVPALTTLYAGQVNALILLTVAWAFFAFRRRRETLSGIALAIGTMLKVIPIALTAYLFWRQRFRLVVAFIAGLLLIVLLTMPLVGVEIYKSYLTNGIALGVRNEIMLYPPNQSLLGFLARLLVHPATGRVEDQQILAQTLARSLSVLVVAATVLICWPKGSIEAFFDLELSLVLIAVHLIAPVTWYHHLLLLAIPFTVLAQRGWQGTLSNPILGLALLAYGLIDIQGLFWHQLEPYPWLTSLATYGMLILWGLLGWLILKQKFPRAWKRG